MKFLKLLFFPFWKFEKHIDLLFDLQQKYSRETFRHLRNYDEKAARESHIHWMEIRQRINTELADVLGRPHVEVETFEEFFSDIFRTK